MHCRIVEMFKHGAQPAYARFSQRGRLNPKALEYVRSVELAAAGLPRRKQVTQSRTTCYPSDTTAAHFSDER